MGKANDWSGKVALVTGASSGIGQSTALEFAKLGANVVLADCQEEAGQKAAQMIAAETGSKAIFVKCDVSKSADVKNLMSETIRVFGRLDCAFNNAGIEGIPAPTADCTEENWDRTIDINLKGVWLCMKEQLPIMIKQGSGSIVNCASIAGVVGFMNVPAYTASKHGIIGLTKTAALEYAKSNIRVNAVCPGVIHTAMVDRFTQGSEENLKLLCAAAPMARPGQPVEIASAVTWLCSSAASFVTGHSLVIDGGWVAQ